FSIFYAITFTMFSLIYAYIARFFIKRLSFSDLSLNKLYLILVSLFLLIILGLIYFYLPNQNVSFGDVKFISIIYVVVIIIYAIFIHIYSLFIIASLYYTSN